ncbi:MAG: ABC transporter ATP-binding protein [Spirochaetes bacterium]|nr:ABC transporter ATP-binding protein [Spirochaetota bacterium]
MSNERTNINQKQGHGPGIGPGYRAMMMPGEKPKNFKRSMSRLLRYIAPFKTALVFTFVISALSTLFSVVGPKILGSAITILSTGIMNKLHKLPDSGIDYSAIGKILLFLSVLFILSSVLQYAAAYIMAGVSQKTVYKLRKDINEKLSRLPLKYLDSKAHGEILSRVTYDVDTIASTLQQSLLQIISSVITLVGSIAMMLTISWQLTAIAVMTLPFYLAVTLFIAKKSQQFYRSQSRFTGELNSHVEEMYSGHKIVKAFGREKYSESKFDEINLKLYRAGWKAQFLSGIIMPVMNFISNLGYVFVCVFGGMLVTKRMLTLGDIQAFIQYSRQFTHPIIQTANIANILQSTVACAERVFEILDEEEEQPDSGKFSVPSQVRGAVKFKDVTFGYSDDKILMNRFNIDVNAGETVAIVGPTGAGKTTLVNLLMRFYEIECGEITIDGLKINDFPRGNLRSMFGMVLQDTWLFNGSIRDNIAYGREGASEDEIIEAAKAAHADHFIRTLPEGYDTMLNEEASNISQGQRQLLTIARAFLSNPPVLILDEATSSVDTRTELIIRKAIEKLMINRTSFVIAHRLSTIRDAHMILVMNEGSIIEKGNHRELLEQKGFYAELYRSQFSGSAEEINNHYI